MGDVVSVVHGDAATLQRGVEVRLEGANLLVLDLFDAGRAGRGGEGDAGGGGRPRWGG